MEKQTSSLQLKLRLLKALQLGNIQQSSIILPTVISNTKSNTQMYTALHSFISTHKHQITQIQQQQKQEEEKVVIVQGQDQEWQSDQSIHLSDTQDDEDQLIQQKDIKAKPNDQLAMCKIQKSTLNPLKLVKNMSSVSSKNKNKQEFLKYCDKNKNENVNKQNKMTISSIVNNRKQNLNKIIFPKTNKNKFV